MCRLMSLRSLWVRCSSDDSLVLSSSAPELTQMRSSIGQEPGERDYSTVFSIWRIPHSALKLGLADRPETEIEEQVWLLK